MSPVFACRVPASDTRITRSLNLGTLALIALCACTPIRAGDVVSTAASPLAQLKSLRQVGLPAAAPPNTTAGCGVPRRSQTVALQSVDL